MMKTKCRMQNATSWSIVLLLVFVSVTAWGRALSDLSREEFEKKFETKGPSAESPFVPKPVAKEELLVQDLQLTGVAIGDEQAYALISGQVVRMGDRVAGYRVRYIGEDQVILQRLDDQVVLRMQGGL